MRTYLYPSVLAQVGTVPLDKQVVGTLKNLRGTLWFLAKKQISKGKERKREQLSLVSLGTSGTYPETVSTLFCHL